MTLDDYAIEKEKQKKTTWAMSRPTTYMYPCFIGKVITVKLRHMISFLI